MRMAGIRWQLHSVTYVHLIPKAHFAATRRNPRRRDLQERAHHHDAAGHDSPRCRRQARAEPVREQLPRPGAASGRCRGGAGGARTSGAMAWLACGSSVARKRIHKQLERAISEFLGTEDTILYSSCFDANGGLFETLLGPEDAIISDELNHASIIDGVRLCKAQRFRYKNNNMADLEAKLEEAKQCAFQDDRHRWRFLDGRLHRESARHL